MKRRSYLKAMLAAANRFLVANQSASYEPLYRACYESFPSDLEAPYCHWKVTWVAYLHRRKDEADLLREQTIHDGVVDVFEELAVDLWVDRAEPAIGVDLKDGDA